MNTNNVCKNCSKCYIHIFILLTLYLFIITPKKTKTVFEHFVDIYKNDNACSSYSLDRNHMMCQYRGLYGGECDPNLNEKCMKDRHYIGVLVGRKAIMPVHRWFDTADRKYKYVARRRNRKFVWDQVIPFDDYNIEEGQTIKLHDDTYHYYHARHFNDHRKVGIVYNNRTFYPLHKHIHENEYSIRVNPDTWIKLDIKKELNNHDTVKLPHHKKSFVAALHTNSMLGHF